MQSSLECNGVGMTERHRNDDDRLGVKCVTWGSWDDVGLGGPPTNNIDDGYHHHHGSTA